MTEIVGLVTDRRNITTPDGLRVSRITLTRATIDGESVNGDIGLASAEVSQEEASAIFRQFPEHSVLVVDATPSASGDIWRLNKVVATDRSDDRLDVIASTTSPARHTNDVVEFKGTEHVVPDFFRVDPLDLPGVGLAYSRYRMGSDLCFAPDGWHTDPIQQDVLDMHGPSVSLWPNDDNLDGAARTIRNFSQAGSELRNATAPHIFDYYRDVAHAFGDEDGFPAIAKADQVWQHVHYNHAEAHLTQEDGHWYLVVEGECAWEREHGLQMVFADGNRICRVSSYDGHPLNDDPSVIFQPNFNPNLL